MRLTIVKQSAVLKRTVESKFASSSLFYVLQAFKAWTLKSAVAIIPHPLLHPSPLSSFCELLWAQLLKAKQSARMYCKSLVILEVAWKPGEKFWPPQWWRRRQQGWKEKWGVTTLLFVSLGFSSPSGGTESSLPLWTAAVVRETANMQAWGTASLSWVSQRAWKKGIPCHMRNLAAGSCVALSTMTAPLGTVGTNVGYCPFVSQHALKGGVHVCELILGVFFKKNTPKCIM